MHTALSFRIKPAGLYLKKKKKENAKKKLS